MCVFGLVLFFGSLPGISCGDPSLVLPKQVHAFMYLWYGNPETDGKYLHWDHEVLPHWEERVNEQYPEVGMHFQPPQNIHSPYYPLHGTYSSNDRELLSQQFTDMGARHRGGSRIMVGSTRQRLRHGHAGCQYRRGHG